jgi:hypothetical protein
MDPIQNGYCANYWSPREKNARTALIVGAVVAVAGAAFLALNASAVAVIAVPFAASVAFCALGGFVALVAGTYLLHRMSLEDSTANDRIQKNLAPLNFKNTDIDKEPKDAIVEIMFDKTDDNELIVHSTTDGKTVKGSDGKDILAPRLFMKDLERARSFTVQKEIVYSNSWKPEKSERCFSMGKAVETLIAACSEGREDEKGKLIAYHLMRCMVQLVPSHMAYLASALYPCRINAAGARVMVSTAQKGDDLSFTSAASCIWEVQVKGGEAEMILRESILFNKEGDQESPYALVHCKKVIKVSLDELAAVNEEQEVSLPSLTVTDKWSKFFYRPSSLGPYIKDEDEWTKNVEERLKGF